MSPREHSVELADGSRLEYASLVVCVGARQVSPYRNAATFRLGGEPIGSMSSRRRTTAARSASPSSFPPARWPLPIYELALMARRRADESGAP